MTISEIFEELNTVYNEAWFVDAQEKFYNHPANKNKEATFSIIVIDELNNNNEMSKIITLENFVFGVRDGYFDNIHDDNEMDKLEQIGYLPNGYPEMGLPNGEKFNSSNAYYPNPSLQAWQNKIIAKIDKSLSLVTNLAEKELLIDALGSVIKFYKESLEANNMRSDILTKLLNTIYDYISDFSNEISELNTFIEDNTKNHILNFNLDQAGLARLIKLLIEKGILENSSKSDNLILKWFSRNATVKSNTAKKILPKSLDAEFRRLARKQNLDLNTWFNNLG